MAKPTADTDQLRFWRGEFGKDYVGRNDANPELLRPRVAMWAPILRALAGSPPASALEVGCNIGLNLRAISTLSDATLYGLEPNDDACKILVRDQVLPAERVLNANAFEIPMADGAVDLAFTSGVLIHIHPDDLGRACDEIHRVAQRYIVCVEYFADQPEGKPYRGHEDRLFKRDFGGFYLDRFPGLELVDCGFFWKRTTGLDNLTWWAFRKPQAG